jgi:prepilin-type N-terminal cleavage/methylation domain-containing protein
MRMKMRFFLNEQKILHKGFSITEVIIATVIFSFVVAGSISAVSALKKPAYASKEDVTAAYLAKQILEGLRSDVNAENWNSGELNPNGGPGSNGVYNNLNAVIIDGITYTPAYQVENDTLTSARKVTLTIDW